MAYNSLPTRKPTLKQAVNAEPINSFSGIRLSKVDQAHKNKNMSPKSFKRKVNTFIEEVKTNKEATALVFEELCKYRKTTLICNFCIAANTSKMHRHALHSKLDSIETNCDIRSRGQTAGVGIRLNPKLAGQ